MDKSNFEISWSERKKIDENDVHFDPNDFADWPMLDQLLFKLTYFNDCEWYIKIDNYGLEFNYRPDLTTVFLKLPEMLEFVTQTKSGEYNLYFCEQGTDLNIAVKNHGANILILLKKYEYSRFDNIPDKQLVVSNIVFCNGWIKFIRKVLSEIEDENPKIIFDKSFKNYEKRVVRIENYMKQNELR